ncbi:MAG: hypothetical protein GJ676_19265 [Rhodobacteraceae bacterium]|nr:hypothetical protein [Paracoccaceae bacterium]
MHLVGNTAGLILAMLLLPGFTIDPLSILVVVVVFTLAQVVLGPLITKLSEKNVPALMGGIALVIVFFGLILTDMLATGFSIGGISNLLAATLLVWLGALIANVALQNFVFKSPSAKK